MVGRLIVISDIHGCFMELLDLLDAVKYDRSKDRLVSVGDLVDKGPKSFEVVELMRNLGARVVMGNHDEKFVRYWRHELKCKTNDKYKNPMQFSDEKKDLYVDLHAQGHIDWMATFKPYMMVHPSWVVVHGGFVPGVALDDQQEKQIIRLRYLFAETGKMAPLTDDLKQPPGSVFWSQRWDGPFNVIYGHTAASLDGVRMDGGPTSGTFAWGIDTGCAYGGKLTALVFEDSFDIWPRVVQVPAHQAYAPYYEDDR